MPFVTVQMLTASQLKETLMWKLTGIVDREQLSLGLGILGMPGSTAYGGLLDVLAAKKGETLWVSAAAGAVGSMVGQIAKNVVGMTVVGSCGGEQKGKIIREQFGFDHSVDYKTVSTAEELAAKVRDCVPEGIDCYFENVGGIHFEAAMSLLKRHGRIAVCGSISSYNSAKPEYCKINISNMIYSFQRVEGFVCHPWLTHQKGIFSTIWQSGLKRAK